MSRGLNMAEKRKNGYVKLELHIGLKESLREETRMRWNVLIWTGVWGISGRKE